MPMHQYLRQKHLQVAIESLMSISGGYLRITLAAEASAFRGWRMFLQFVFVSISRLGVLIIVLVNADASAAEGDAYIQAYTYGLKVYIRRPTLYHRSAAEEEQKIPAQLCAGRSQI